MVNKVKILNAENDEPVRVGSPRANEINQPLLFGFLTLSDAFKIALTVFGITTFMIKDNIRINALEEGQKNLQINLTEITKSMQSYMEESDGFHSSIFGTQFKGGHPRNDGFKNNGNISGEGSK
jgi:hypothetical protein